MAKIHSKIVIPVALAYVGGALHDFVYKTVLRGEERSFENEELILNGLDPNNQPTFTELQAVVTNGGFFEGIKLGLELTDAGAQLNVPAAIIGATFVDDQGVTQNRTWADWVRVQPNVKAKKKVGQNLYIIKAAFNGSLLNSDELAAAHVQAGIAVLEWAEMKLRNVDETWEDSEL